MKYLLTLVASILISTVSYAGTISLNDEQFENVDMIDAALRAEYAQYKGLHGSKESITVIGISGGAANTVIDKMNFNKIVSDKAEIKAEKKMIRQKMRDLAIAQIESEGKSLKHKNKVKALLESEEDK